MKKKGLKEWKKRKKAKEESKESVEKKLDSLFESTHTQKFDILTPADILLSVIYDGKEYPITSVSSFSIAKRGGIGTEIDVTIESMLSDTFENSLFNIPGVDKVLIKTLKKPSYIEITKIEDVTIELFVTSDEDFARDVLYIRARSMHFFRSITKQ